MQQLEIILDTSAHAAEKSVPRQKQTQQEEMQGSDGVLIETASERKRKRHREYMRGYLKRWRLNASPEQLEKYRNRSRHYAARATEEQKAKLKQQTKEWWLRMKVEQPERLKEYRRTNYLKHREQLIEKAKERHRRKREYRFHKYIADNYGLTFPEYEEKLKSSPNCEICGRVFEKKPKPHLDHNHTTGRIRGLLCSACNTGLGVVERDCGMWLSKAKTYLAKYDS